MLMVSFLKKISIPLASKCKAVGEGPSGLALDNETHRLFSATSKLMVALDAPAGMVTGTLPAGDRVGGSGFDQGLKNYKNL